MTFSRLISLCLLMVLLTAGFHSWATHYRAGEITYRLVSFLTYEVTVITYTKTSGQSILADRDSIEISWGNGDLTIAPRTNGNDLNGNGIPDGEIIIDDFKRNEYKAVYSYSGAAPFYVISTIDPNRIGGIVNIDDGQSILIPFYIEDTLRIYPEAILPSNSSPLLLNPPIDFANVNDTFYHNPNAWDVEGDSLHFRLVPPKQDQLTDVPNYKFPDNVIPGPDNNFTIDPNTGEIIWATPKRTGIYNVAIVVEEFRNGLFLGTVLRDMQIIVKDIENDPPQIKPILDTCVRAGNFIQIKVEATDPNQGDSLTRWDSVTLSATGGPFEVTNPATFVVDVPDTARLYESGTFTWGTVCDHIRQQFYMTVFRASDNHFEGSSFEPLVDLETWLITVIPPPPRNLTATLNQDLSAEISWDSLYDCASFEDFRYFSVWRKFGCDSFLPDPCETGLAGRGFTKIADSITNYSYLDETLVRGHEYSYRVLAHFSLISQNGTEYNRQESVPSNEACVILPFDLPIITNVSIERTDSLAGEIFIAWSNPRPTTGSAQGIDTIQTPGPYRYDLYRSIGFPGEANMVFVTQFNADSFWQLNDTTYLDAFSNLNTLRNPFSYKIAFYSDGDSIGETETASSPWLAIRASDNSAELEVIAEVPWDNYRYVYYRGEVNSNFIDVNDTNFIIEDTSVAQLLDTGLINDSTYCYRVRTEGQYTASQSFISDSLVNFSQDSCVVPIDTIPPCAVIELTISNPCDTTPKCLDVSRLQNSLSWNIPDDGCADDAEHYKLYYQAGGNDDFILLDSVFGVTNRTYQHDLSLADNGLAACYYITAIDEKGNESATGDTVCIGNCPFIELPNVFTPNQDGFNDFFRPRCTKFVEKIDISIVNRWGNVVFEGEGLPPTIDWDGIDQKNGKRVKDGVYFYSGFYYEITLDGPVKRPLPPNERGGGFIHVITD